MREGQEYPRDDILRKLVSIQYERNDINFDRGKFRVRGDVIEIFPAGYVIELSALNFLEMKSTAF